MSKLRVSKIRISNILGIEDLEFSPSGFTEISGANGTGKTSVLSAVRAVLKGGNDATLLRKGADKGEIVLVLDNGAEIRKRVTEDRSTVDIIKDGAKLLRPADVIKGMTDILSCNPIEFLRAPEKDRVNVLMEAMPVAVDRAKLAEWDPGSTPPASLDGLDLIEHVRRNVYDERTGLNRAAKEKAATIKQLGDALPPAVDIEDDSIFRAQLVSLDEALSKKLAGIQEKLDGLEKDCEAKVTALQAQIEELRSGLEVKRKLAAAARQKAVEEASAARSEVSAKLAVIESKRVAAAGANQARATMQMMRSELENLEKQIERSNVAIEQIDAYKSELLAKLPIRGLEVRDGKVYRDGIAFDRLNTAQQVAIAVEIAKLRAGELGLICVDGLEQLDADAFNEFRTQALASALQLIVTRVTTGPLAIAEAA